ncbi:flagellar biosynthesis protein FlhB [Holophaga foetida]|uniref:flagellar biosynthesis protein FlhB n=1 Tax=Holophaga foetida TaxID=35839 RepID=UPI00024736F4|nr:flagellar biosynthesis protein FlhB [Holophaga foetida]
MKDPGRTEKATPKRRKKAREDGMILRVPDLDATLLLWANFFLFLGLWGSTFTLLANQTAYFLRKASDPSYLTDGNLGHLGTDLLSIVLRVLLPFLGLNWLIALGIQAAQHGFQPTFEMLKLKFDRLNPFSGMKRLLSFRSLMETAKSLAKFAILAWAAYGVLGPRMGQILATLQLPLGQTLAFMQDTLFALYRNVMLAMLTIAAVDFAYQRHVFEDNLKMTKQEIRDEAKDSDGNPEIKGRQKSMMVAALMRRIRTAVPKASVVITNPTHFAVALKYEPGSPAPICVAKGVDHLAFQIRQIAKDHDITIVENVPLARALYRSVEVDKAIPPDLYQAVAQVLAYVYKLKGSLGQSVRMR